ncbi:MAG: hypothetical protein ACOH15_10250 [Acetobacterium sp.]
MFLNLNYDMRINKNFSVFYYDLLTENVIYKEHSVVTDFWRNLSKSCGLNYNEFEIAFISYSNMGASQGANLAYDAGLIDCSSIDFINASIRSLLTNMRLDEQIISEVIAESSKIEKKIQIQMEKNFIIR